MRERVSPDDRWARWRRTPLLNRVLLLWLVVALVNVVMFGLRGRSFFVSPAYIRIFVWPCLGIGFLYGFGWFKILPVAGREKWGALKRFQSPARPTNREDAAAAAATASSSGSWSTIGSESCASMTRRSMHWSREIRWAFAARTPGSVSASTTSTTPGEVHVPRADTQSVPRQTRA